MLLQATNYRKDQVPFAQGRVYTPLALIMLNIFCADCQCALVYVQNPLHRDTVTLVESGLSLDLMHSHVHLTWWVYIHRVMDE